MKIFIDTSAWVALENKKDTHYEDAVTVKYEITNKRYRLYTSKAIMETLGIEEGFSFDKDFEQMGFVKRP